MSLKNVRDERGYKTFKRDKIGVISLHAASIVFWTHVSGV